MNIEQIKQHMQRELGTLEQLVKVAEKIGVSQATMYRFKSNPEAMQLGHFLKLTELIGFPTSEDIAWLPKEFVPEEEYRLKHESAVAKVNGSRMTVTPFFSVNVELPEITKITAEEIYGVSANRGMDLYLEARKKRKDLYLNSKYKSKEIINGYLYLEFFRREKMHRGISESQKEKQIQEIIKSMDLESVQRRVYFGHDLPLITWYSTGVALLRFGQFTIQVTGSILTDAAADIFNEYYLKCDLKNNEDVKDFIKNPIAFLPSKVF